MPKLPSAIANIVESKGIPCTVTAVDDLSPRFRRLHLQGDAFIGHDWVPCQVNTFRVNRTDFRRYTPDSFESGTGRFSILFYRHNGDGTGQLPPGEAWLASLSVGSTVQVLGLTATKNFRGQRTDGDVIVTGDATTVGLWYSMIEWSGMPTPIRGVVEVPPSDVAMISGLLPGIDVIPEQSDPGVALLARLNQIELSGVTRAYCSGHAQSIPPAREIIRRGGLGRSQIASQPYWATGKVGL